MYHSINNKILYGKTNKESEVFDVFVYAARDIESILIPSHIKKIEDYAFCQCINLKSVSFEPNSMLKFIGYSAFRSAPIKTIILPQSLREIKLNAFKETCLTSIYILSEIISIDFCFVYCKHLNLISFPNANKIFFYTPFDNFKNDVIIELLKEAEIHGDAFKSPHVQIKYISFAIPPQDQIEINNDKIGEEEKDIKNNEEDRGITNNKIMIMKSENENKKK